MLYSEAQNRVARSKDDIIDGIIDLENREAKYFGFSQLCGLMSDIYMQTHVGLKV